MSGTVALHGGGEYVAGDEPAMDALVAAGAVAAGAGEPVRVVIVPTAVARHRPELAARTGARAFGQAGARLGVAVRVDVAPVLDRASAGAAAARLLEAADVVHLPGGDPDVIPAVLPGTAAWAAIQAAFARGACIAGASAGAMALAARCWTPSGAVDGLGLVPGIAVLPHFDPRRLAAWRRAVDPDGGLAWLGLDERTLVLGRPGAAAAWTVHGTGQARLLRAGSDAPPDIAGPGGSLALPVV